jgi:hypothetical protein
MAVEEDINALRSELEKEAQQAILSGRINYAAVYLLVFLTVVLSAVAGLGGLFFDMPSKIVAGLALLPGVMTAIAISLKLQEKANLHYDRFTGLSALAAFLRFEMPQPPTYPDLAAVSKLRSDFRMRIDTNWKATASITQAEFAAARAAVVKPKE